MSSTKGPTMADNDLPDVPWIAGDGTIDMKQFPLDIVFKQATGEDRRQAKGALRVLSAASSAGREEADVFLIGFLVSRAPDDWEMRTACVKALEYARTKECAALLFSEIRRVKMSNTTRGYVNTIVGVLRRFPEELVWEEFQTLADDKAFSPRLRAVFGASTGRDDDPDIPL